MNIYEVLRARGYTTVPEEFYTYIENWKSWYDGYVKQFHRYRIWNGMKFVQCRLYSLGMAKKVCEDWANLLLNEKCKITLEGKPEQAFIDSVFERNNFTVKSNEMQEIKAARGTVAYVPTVVNASVDEQTGKVNGSGGEIRIDYVPADLILPLTWENGIVTECAFGSHKAIKKDSYLYICIHKRTEKGTYDIENLLYRDTKGSLSEVKLADVPGFENVAPVVHTPFTQRMFVIDRLNIVNNVDATLPMGISVFANAIDQLKGVDLTYDSYVNEFQLGKKRVMLKPQATKNFHTGEPLFDTSDVVFYVLPADGQDGDIIKEINMNLRTAEHNAGIQDMYHIWIEGVSERTYTDEELENIDPPPFEFEGKQYTFYEATQKQRQVEASLRKVKRELTAAKGRGDDEEYTTKAVRYRRLNEEYEAFSKAAGLRPQYERGNIAEFGPKEAREAKKAANK